jgi:hypothetical protein
VPTVLDEDFDGLAGPYRTELVVHCYRLLGSVHEAEGLVQETMLRGRVPGSAGVRGVRAARARRKAVIDRFRRSSL